MIVAHLKDLQNRKKTVMEKKDVLHGGQKEIQLWN